MKKQQQESGSNSTNVQAAGNVSIYNSGLSISQVREIADDLFKRNFLDLAEQAATTAEERAHDLLQSFLANAERTGLDLGRAQEPDIQYALFTAQRDYARSGRLDLKNILVDLLTRKFTAQPGGVIDIVLAEAIETARKLTQAQIDALTVRWIVARVVIKEISSIETLTSQIEKHVGPFIDGVPKGITDYEHIQYTGCGIVDMGGVGIGSSMINFYPGLFQIGLEVHEIPPALWESPERARLFCESRRAPDKYEVNAVSADAARALAVACGHADNAEVFVGLIHSAGHNAVEHELAEMADIWRKLIYKWRRSSIGNLTLSSVGYAIAYCNWARQSDETADLALWVFDGPLTMDDE